MHAIPYSIFFHRWIVSKKRVHTDVNFAIYSYVKSAIRIVCYLDGLKWKTRKVEWFRGINYIRKMILSPLLTLCEQTFEYGRLYCSLPFLQANRQCFGLSEWFFLFPFELARKRYSFSLLLFVKCGYTNFLNIHYFLSMKNVRIQNAK